MLAVTKSRQHVLIAVDDVKSRDLIRELITFNYGDKISIIEATNGIDATSKIHFQSFNCIIVDFSLPKKNGIAVFNSIRNCNMNETTPVIMLVEEEEKEKIDKEYPFLYFFHKPIDGNALLEMTSQQLKLGKGDQRVCASLLNIICQGLIDFMSSFSTCEYNIGSPELKPFTESKSDYNIYVQVQYEKTKTKLYMCLPEETVASMRANLKFLSRLKKDHIARSLAVFTLKRSITQFADAHRLKTKIEIVEEQDLKDILKKQGIAVDIKDTDNRNFNLFVLPDVA